MFTKEGKKEKRKGGREDVGRKAEKLFLLLFLKEGGKEQRKEGKKGGKKGARRKKAKMFFSCGHATL